MNEVDLLREIIDAQLEMVCRFTADGTILYANPAYAKAIGARQDKLTGDNLWQYVTGIDREGVERQLAQLRADHPDVTIENRFETTNGPRWILWRNHGLTFDAKGHWTVAQSTGVDITERKLLEEQLQLVVEELNHRVKNTLMIVQSLAWQTFRGKDMPDDLLTVFGERLAALASAHTVLSQSNWSNSDLEKTVRTSLTVANGATHRIKLAGPPVKLQSRQIVPVIMTIHELATNAIKYGALSNGSGSVKVQWSMGENRSNIDLEWRETGGPAVNVPQKKGFGTRLIREMVSRQLSGDADLRYLREGVICRLTFPLAENEP